MARFQSSSDFYIWDWIGAGFFLCKAHSRVEAQRIAREIGRRFGLIPKLTSFRKVEREEYANLILNIKDATGTLSVYDFPRHL